MRCDMRWIRLIVGGVFVAVILAGCSSSRPFTFTEEGIPWGVELLVDLPEVCPPDGPFVASVVLLNKSKYNIMWFELDRMSACKVVVRNEAGREVKYSGLGADVWRPREVGNWRAEFLSPGHVRVVTYDLLRLFELEPGNYSIEVTRFISKSQDALHSKPVHFRIPLP